MAKTDTAEKPNRAARRANGNQNGATEQVPGNEDLVATQQDYAQLWRIMPMAYTTMENIILKRQLDEARAIIKATKT